MFEVLVPFRSRPLYGGWGGVARPDIEPASPPLGEETRMRISCYVISGRLPFGLNDSQAQDYANDYGKPSVTVSQRQSGSRDAVIWGHVFDICVSSYPVARHFGSNWVDCCHAAESQRRLRSCAARSGQFTCQATWRCESLPCIRHLLILLFRRIHGPLP